MPPFQINENEWLALEGEPLKVFKIYCLVRRHMNYETGISGNISLDAFRKALEVRVVKGRKKEVAVEYATITQKEICRVIQRLTSLGLVDNLGGYLFRCKIATLNKSNQNMMGISGAKRRAQKNIKESLLNKQFLNDESSDDDPMRGALQETGIKENNNTNVLLKKKRASKLTDDFSVTANHIAIAEKSGLPNPYSEIDAFKDYHISKGSLFQDWDRAFYTWLRNAKKFNKGGINGAHKQAHRQSKLDWFDEINRRYIREAERAEQLIEAEFTVN